jgi:hypothetical protein
MTQLPNLLLESLISEPKDATAPAGREDQRRTMPERMNPA